MSVKNAQSSTIRATAGIKDSAMALDVSDDNLDPVTAFWRQLQTYLGVKITLTGDDLDGPVNVTATFVNLAPTGPGFPDVQFYAIRVGGGRPGAMSQSFRTTLSELDDAPFDIEGSFMGSYDSAGWKVTRRIHSLRSELNDQVRLYRARLEDTDVRGQLTRARGSIDIPGPETTVAELDRVREQIVSAEKAVRATSDSVSQLDSPFAGRIDIVSGLARAASNDVLNGLNALHSALGMSFAAVEQASQVLAREPDALLQMEAAYERLFEYFN